MGLKRRVQPVGHRLDAVVLRGENVILRPYEPADRDAFIALFTDPVVMKHVDGPMTIEAAERVFAAHIDSHREYYRLLVGWAAELRGSRTYVGSGSLLRNREEATLEVGFLLRPEHWGRGLATEIGRLLLRYGHDQLDVPRIVATVDSDNHASIRVLEKIGMVEAKRIHDSQGEYFLYESIATPATLPE